ncbi:MAG: 50S ribosomal protein L28 [Elusimicrobia bacterium]|nr:50S ribosomal protein L28 [Elusimicrobiota bacterium]
MTGVGPQTGMNVSHSNRHTKRRWEPNLKKKRIFVPEENRWMTVRLTANALKTLTRKGLKSVNKMRARVVRRNPSFKHA